jgi:hypothetical protein
MVVPDPSNCYRYYVFSLDARFNRKSNEKTRLSYSIVEILEGEPHIVSQDHLLLEDFLSEGMTGTIQSNGHDFWVVVYNFRTASVIAIPITDKGINIGQAFLKFRQFLSGCLSRSDTCYNQGEKHKNKQSFHDVIPFD